MHIMTISVTVLQYKCSINDFKEDKLKKKDSQKSNKIFGVGPVLGG